MLPKIPTQMFTCHPNTGLIPVKGVQVFEVGAHNITYFFQRQICARFTFGEEKIDFVENPWPALRSSAYHDAVAPGCIEHGLRSLRRIHIAVRDDGNLDGGLDGGHGFVLSITLIEIRTRASVNRKCLNTVVFRDSCDANC